MKPIINRQVEDMNNRMGIVAYKAKLGDRIKGAETFEAITHSYASAHADKTLTIDDLPNTPIVRITLTSADAAANLILPADVNKVYLIYNNSGQTITAMVEDETGVALANGGKYLAWSNGTDIVVSVPEVTLSGTQTLTNKTLTSPTITTPTITGGTATSTAIVTPDITEGASTHSYGTGHADWTLSVAERKTKILVATGTADAAVNAIATPTANKIYIVSNSCGQALTFKATGQTGVEIADGKTAMVRGNSTDFVRVTADA